MVSKEVTIINPTGLHLNAAGKFSQMAANFECAVNFELGNTSGSAKSLLSLLGSGIKKGDTVRIICDGKDEEEALQAMISLVESGLGE